MGRLKDEAAGGLAPLSAAGCSQAVAPWPPDPSSSSSQLTYILLLVAAGERRSSEELQLYQLLRLRSVVQTEG